MLTLQSTVTNYRNSVGCTSASGRPCPLPHRPTSHAQTSGAAADCSATPVCHRQCAPLFYSRIPHAMHSPCRVAATTAAGTSASAMEQRPAAQQAGLLLGLGTPGSWDEAAVGSPVVRCYVGPSGQQRWFMWYGGRKADSPAAAGGLDVLAPASGCVGVAVSRDGIHWFRGSETVEGARGAAAAGDVGAVLAPNPDWWTFDTCHLAPSDVQVFSNSSAGSGGVGVYWMFYSGGDFEPVRLPDGIPCGSGPASQSGAAAAAAHDAVEASTAAAAGDDVGAAAASAASAGSGAGGGTAEGGPGAVEGLRMRPGLAMSQDGRNWARIEAEHHTGALLDVGKEGEPDQLFVTSPQVVAVGPGDMRMFYTSWDPSRRRFVVLLATSPDGFKWTKRGVIFDPAALSAAVAAASDDENDAGGAFDALGAAAVSVVRDVDNRQFLMFYEAVATDNRRSIGLAVSKDGRVWRRYGAPVLEAAEGAAAGATRAGGGAAGQEEAQGVAEAAGNGDEAAAEAWDGGDVGSPCAVSMSAGRWRLYYAGRRRSGTGPWQGIGLALSAEGAASFEGVPVSFKRRPHRAGGAP